MVFLLVAALAVAPSARAGGDFLDLAVAAGRVWLVGPFGVRAFDAASGQAAPLPPPRTAAYPLSVTVAGGVAWVASVANGFGSGTLTRIDGRTGRERVVWHTDRGSVQYVAAGARGVWALFGSAKGNRIALFALSGQLLRMWRVPSAGRIAADRKGCWISTSGWLLRIDPQGRLHRVVRAPLGDVTTGAGAVWLPRETSTLRIDEQSGRLRTLATGRLRLGGFQHDLAAGAGTLWALDHGPGRSTHSTLVRLDPVTGRRTKTASVPGIGDAVAVDGSAVWVASVIAPPGRSATGYRLIRFDSRTLRRTLTLSPI